MISPLLRFAFAVFAWLLAAFVILSQDHHTGQLIAPLSILLALAAVVPKGELNLKATSTVLQIADLLANTYLLGLLALAGSFGVHAALKINGVL